MPLAISITWPFWAFYALGPQFVLCLLFGYLTARDTHGSMIDWLVLGFLASIVPFAGVVLMAWLWWRRRESR